METEPENASLTVCVVSEGLCAYTGRAVYMLVKNEL